MLEEALELAQDAMEKAKDRLGKELGRIRAGRASPSLLDEVRVDNYGSMMPLNQVSTISVSDARLLIVKPWDRNMVAPVEKAIINAQLGLNPSSDGVILRVPIPPLTEERRRGLVKQVKEYGEAARIGVRQGRREGNDLLKEAEKDKDISEDELKRGLSKIQELTDKFVGQIDEAVDKKESEIMDD
jgi:ribosome recycling factor